MAGYTYKLNKTDKPKTSNYMRDELESLTTIQLRDICYREKIAVGQGYKLNREYAIELIMKYRGYEKHYFIEEHEEKKYNRFKKYIMECVSIRDNNRMYTIPTKINIFTGASATEDDNIKIENNSQDHEANAILIDGDKKVRGIFNIKNVNDKYFLTYNKDLIDKDLENGVYRNYSLGIFTEKGSKLAYDLYNELSNEKLEREVAEDVKLYDSVERINMTIVNISELVIKKVPFSENVLVIDFGTSNTSVGVYENGEIKTVKFAKKENDFVDYVEVLPTVVSVKSCASDVVFEFGYDALASASKNSYNTSHSVFYGIKKWVNNYTKDEEITDKDANHSVVSRKEIIKSYLLHVIECAEIAHKCKYKKIHITSPIKQKGQFLSMYKEVLIDCDYSIEIDNALDEGISVLYNSISNQIVRGNFENEKLYKALVIDCGGGTTDLTSCNYIIKDNRITYDLDIVTTYANGETNFGGNSLTFRIFQYLKVLFVGYYMEDEYILAESLFDTDTQGVYRFVDEFGVNEIYERLENEYEKAEEYIPTRYNEYKHLSSDEFMKIRSNFYFLWNLAERIKLQFYQTLNRSITDFHENGLKLDPNSNKIISEESWRINIVEDGIFKLKTKTPQIAISKEEVEIIIKGDIYYVIKKFIEPLFENGELDDFDMIKLTGQTCKIDIFRDALKEFIAGKYIQSNSKDKELKNFKLSCLEGAIKYENAHKIGRIAPTLKNESPITPYELVGYTHNDEEVVLMSNLSSLETTYGYISKNIQTKLIELVLKNGDGKVVHRYEFFTDFADYKPTSYTEIHNEYKDKIAQTEVDQIDENEIKLFAISYEDNWGFYLVPIARSKDDKVYIGEKVYYPFENDEWEVNYFDGMK